MYYVLFSLIIIDCFLLAFASFVGVTLDSTGDMMRHFLMGFCTTVLTCFIHVLVMFYLIGTGVNIREAVEDHEELRERFVPLTRQLKRRAFPAATLAIFLVIFAALMGGEVHSRIIRPEGELPFRAVTAWWVHLVFVSAALASTIFAFCVELAAVRDNRRAIDEINQVLRAGE